jgi:hypothetical protein
MAGWNTLILAGLTVFSLLAAKRPKDARAPRPEKNGPDKSDAKPVAASV